MTKANPQEVTRLLQAWSAGEEGAVEDLFPLVYGELRRVARRFLRGERQGHTLQATALVHEAYFRLVDQQQVDWQERSHFYSIAARVMRRILVDHARNHQALKRGRDHEKVPLDEAFEVAQERPDDLVALDDALASLAQLDPQKAAVVELRFFGGLTIDDTADTLGCSRSTVVREWQIGRAWLYDTLKKGSASLEP